MAGSGGNRSQVMVPPVPLNKGRITTTNYIQSCYMLQMGWMTFFARASVVNNRAVGKPNLCITYTMKIYSTERFLTASRLYSNRTRYGMIGMPLEVLDTFGYEGCYMFRPRATCTVVCSYCAFQTIPPPQLNQFWII
jgi:hypothetical protein